MAELIRIDVVEHKFDAKKDGKIKRSTKTPEQKKAEQDEKDKIKRMNATKRAIVQSSMALRKLTQVGTSVVISQLNNSFSKQSFEANISGNSRKALILQQNKQLQNAQVNYWSQAIQGGASIAAGFAINPVLGVIQTVGFVTNLGTSFLNQFLEYNESMRQMLTTMQKEIADSEYRRNRLLTNTFTNRGLGR